MVSLVLMLVSIRLVSYATLYLDLESMFVILLEKYELLSSTKDYIILNR
jgi:hypothetical protein